MSPGEVHGRRVSITGTLLGSELALASGSDDEQYPDMAWDSASKGYAVVWQEGTTNGDVHGLILDGSGTVVESETTLSAADNAQEKPAIAYDSDRKRYLVAWADHRHTTDAPDIYGQLYAGHSRVIAYSYDPLGRLTSADYSTGESFEYVYDAVGNRTVMTTVTPLSGTVVTTYTFDAADRLITVTQGGTPTGYTWSDRGELLGDGAQTYGWDAAGRLVAVTTTAGLTVTYQYNGAGHRLAMAVGGVETSYVVDPFSWVDGVPQVLVEERGSESTRYLYGLERVALVRPTKTLYYAPDALGSTRLLVDDDGATMGAYLYTPFGVPLEEAGVENPFRFAGEAWDEQVELLFLRARYYRPEVGRFLSRDPWEGDHERPATLHGFVYVENNPVNLTDPSGMKGIVPWDIYVQRYGDVCAPFHYPLDLLNFTETNDRRAVYEAIQRNFELQPSDVQYYEPLDKNYNPCCSTPDFNQYDREVSGWADFWNWYHKRPFMKNIRIEPDLVKAVLYKESECGNYPGPLGDGLTNVMQVKDGGWGWLATVQVDVNHGLVQDPNISIGAGTRLLMLHFDRAGNWPDAVEWYRGWGLEPRYTRKVKGLWDYGINPHGMHWWVPGFDPSEFDPWYFLYIPPEAPPPEGP